MAIRNQTTADAPRLRLMRAGRMLAALLTAAYLIMGASAGTAQASPTRHTPVAPRGASMSQASATNPTTLPPNPFQVSPGPWPTKGGNCVFWAWRQWALEGLYLQFPNGNANGADWVKRLITGPELSSPPGIWSNGGKQTKLTTSATPQVGDILDITAPGPFVTDQKTKQKTDHDSLYFGVDGHVAIVIGVSSDGLSFTVSSEGWGDPAIFHHDQFSLSGLKLDGASWTFIVFPGKWDPAKSEHGYLDPGDPNGVDNAQYAGGLPLGAPSSQAGPPQYSTVDAAPSQQIPLTMVFNNTGTSSWATSAGYSIAAVNPNFSGPTAETGANVALGSVPIYTGQSFTAQTAITVPATIGYYAYAWSAARHGTPFGSPAVLLIRVAAATSLKFVRAPTVSAISASSATVTWATYGLSDSTVAYSDVPPPCGCSATDTLGNVTEYHAVTLTNLAPGTTYYAIASSGNGSKIITAGVIKFTTIPECATSGQSGGATNTPTNCGPAAHCVSPAINASAAQAIGAVQNTTTFLAGQPRNTITSVALDQPFVTAFLMRTNDAGALTEHLQFCWDGHDDALDNEQFQVPANSSGQWTTGGYLWVYDSNRPQDVGLIMQVVYWNDQVASVDYFTIQPAPGPALPCQAVPNPGASGVSISNITLPGSTITQEDQAQINFDYTASNAGELEGYLCVDGTTEYVGAFQASAGSNSGYFQRPLMHAYNSGCPSTCQWYGDARWYITWNNQIIAEAPFTVSKQ